MNYLSAVDQALSEMSTASHPDASVQAALHLAVAAWERCEPTGGSAADWSLFGTGVMAASELLYPTPAAIAIDIDEPRLPDCERIRARTAGLATAAAQVLHHASSRHTTDARRRWQYEYAAAELHRAAQYLVRNP
jgi:hypothetical protein